MAATPLPIAPAKRDDNIVRLVVSLQAIKKDETDKLCYFDQTKTLPEIVSEKCKEWHIDGDPAGYALKLKVPMKARPSMGSPTKMQEQPPTPKTTERGVYLTEKNRVELKAGQFLELNLSPSQYVSKVLEQLRTHQRNLIIESLTTDMMDITFASQFARQDGSTVLFRLFEEARTATPQDMKGLRWCLSALNELLSHNIVAFDSLSIDFINSAVAIIGQGFSRSDSEAAATVACALRIVALYVKNTAGGYELITKSISFPALSSHTESRNSEFVERALQLINSLIAAAPGERERLELFDSLEKCNIDSNLSAIVYVDAESAAVPSFSHELYLFQSYSLNRLNARRTCFFDPANMDHQQNLKCLRTALPEIDEVGIAGKVRQVVSSSDAVESWRKLGFTNPDQPEKDLQAPPGLLALDIMAYFANQDPQGFSSSVLGQLNRPEKYAFPFVRMSLAVTELLLELLRVGQRPSDDGGNYLPMFFSASGKFFKQMFCACMHITTKTWQSMDAVQEDFDKVLLVLRKQLNTIFALPVHDQPTTVEAFKATVSANYTYAIIEQRDLERMRSSEENLRKTDSVKQVYKQLLAVNERLVGQHRLAIMRDGEFFARPKASKKSRLFLCLAPNNKTLYWDEIDGPAKPPLARLQNSCAVGDLRELSCQTAVPSFKQGREDAYKLAFAFRVDVQQDSVEMVAADQYQYDMWVDGFRALMEKELCEARAKADIERLANLDLKLRLLELYDADLPTALPVPPPPPADLNFYYEVSSESIS
eukprot:m.209938 g.209938  ORF g.209938 m.209938 type:complete len:767 (-) comp15553_c0_seq15:126-2426(-)